jgi:hypothetical protein
MPAPPHNRYGFGQRQDDQAMFEELEWNGIFVDVGRMVRRATNTFVEFLVITYGDQFEAFSNSILGILVWIERLLLGRSEPEIILLIVFGGLISLFVYLISKNSILAGAVFAVEAALFFISRYTMTVGEETMRPMEWLWVQELQIIALIMLIAYSASRKMGWLSPWALRCMSSAPSISGIRRCRPSPSCWFRSSFRS